MNVGMILENGYTKDARVRREAETLAKNGFDVYVLGYNNGKYITHETINNVKITRFKFPRFIFKKLRGLAASFPFYKILWELKIKQFIIDNKIHLLHVHDLPLMPISIKLANIFSLKVVGDFHENFAEAIKLYYWSNTIIGKILINKKKWELLQEDCMEKLDRIIVTAEENINYFSEKYNILKEKFIVVDNSIDIAQFKDEGVISKLDQYLKKKYKDYIVIGYTGGILKNRGIHYIINVLPEFKNTNIKMVIVGKGRFRRVLKKMILHKKIENMVDWYPWQPFQNLMTFTKNFDIGITTLEKNLQTDYTTPNKVFQYMYMEIPVLTTNSKPMLRIIKNTGAGLVFKSGDYNELKECLKRLIENKKLRTNMGVKGKKAVLLKYNWENTSKNLINLYKQIGNCINES